MNNNALVQENTNTQPEENGAQSEKTFTQEEVNRIVSERLARERAESDKKYNALNEEFENYKSALNSKEIEKRKESVLRSWIKEHQLHPSAADHIIKYGVPIDNLYDFIDDNGTIKNSEELENKIKTAFPQYFPQRREFEYRPSSPEIRSNESGLTSKLNDIFKPKI